MVKSPHFEAVFTAFAVIWVGGWGFLMSRYPQSFARINALFGMTWLSGSKYIPRTKKMGFVLMVLAVLSALVFLVRIPLGLARF